MVTPTQTPMQDKPCELQVSVVMPMRNAEPYVLQALESVLQETSLTLEVVVVDDGSTDRSREIVLSLGDPRVRVLDGPCRGFAASVNTALKAAQGKFVMQCDADDLYPSGRIAQQAAWLEANPGYGAVCGAFSTIDARGRPIADFSSGATTADVIDITLELRRGVTRTSLCTWAIRRDALGTVGWHREYFETSPDIDLQLRFGEVHRVAFLRVNTYFYRLHDSSITHTQGNIRRAFFEDTARLFQRQRLEVGTDDLDAGRPPAPPGRVCDAPGKVVSQINGMLVGEAWRNLAKGERGRALSTAWRAVSSRPGSLSTWLSLAKIGLRAAIQGRHSGAAADKD